MKKFSLSILILCLFANAGIAQSRSAIIKDLEAIFKKVEGTTIGSGSSQVKCIKNSFTEKKVFVHVIVKEDGTTAENKAILTKIPWDAMKSYEVSASAGSADYMLAELSFDKDFDQEETMDGKTKTSKTSFFTLIVRKADKDKAEGLLEKLYNLNF